MLSKWAVKSKIASCKELQAPADHASILFHLLSIASDITSLFDQCLAEYTEQNEADIMRAFTQAQEHTLEGDANQTIQNPTNIMAQSLQS